MKLFLLLVVVASLAPVLGFSPRAVLKPLRPRSRQNNNNTLFTCGNGDSISLQEEEIIEEQVQQNGLRSHPQSQVGIAVSRSPFAAYSSFVGRRPFLSNLLQGGVLFGLSDVMAQLCFSSAEVVSFSAMRTMNAGLFGALYSGVLISQWILLMDRYLPGSGLGWRTGTKVAANAFVFGLVGNSCNVFCR
jgi:hypothetical protein